jgi:hypothetical protein
VPCVDVSLRLGERVVDLATRALVAGVVPLPRFGREGEVVATAASVVAQGADLADVSLPPRMVGPVTRSGRIFVVARVGSVTDAVAAVRAGAVAVLAPLTMVAGEKRDGDLALTGAALLVVVDNLSELADARAEARRWGAAVAFDSTRLSGAAAIGCEAAAVADGSRLLRTADVRRSRRVAEVMAAILAARRDAGGRSHDDSEAPT